MLRLLKLRPPSIRSSAASIIARCVRWPRSVGAGGGGVVLKADFTAAFLIAAEYCAPMDVYMYSRVVSCLRHGLGPAARICLADAARPADRHFSAAVANTVGVVDRRRGIP